MLFLYFNIQFLASISKEKTQNFLQMYIFPVVSWS